MKNLALLSATVFVTTSGLLFNSVQSASASSISGLGDPITNSLLTGGTVQDFDASPQGNFSSITLNNVTYIGVDAPLTIGSDFIGQYNNQGVNSIYNGFDYIPSQFQFDFATSVDAFAFNWGASDNTWLLSAFGSGGELIETLIVPQVFASNAGEYFGIAASGITSATLVDLKDRIPEGDYVFIDNFTTKSVSTVPEPTFTLSLLALGTLGAGSTLKRKMKSFKSTEKELEKV
jgi:hypothetical protein